MPRLRVRFKPASSAPLIKSALELKCFVSRSLIRMLGSPGFLKTLITMKSSPLAVIFPHLMDRHDQIKVQVLEKGAQAPFVSVSTPL